MDRRTYATTVAALNMPVPNEIATRYDVAIAVNAGPPLTYTIRATPTGPQLHDRCGALTIDQAGTKTAATTRCW
jgi:type IV pilus assembly protein PilE